MKNNFFNDMQENWMKNLNSIEYNAWIKKMQDQNIHLCTSECNNLANNAMDIARANADFWQGNMENCIEAAQNNIKANNVETVIANNQQVMQSLAFNTAHFAKQMVDKVADLSISSYEHYLDVAMENMNQKGCNTSSAQQNSDPAQENTEQPQQENKQKKQK
jgi:hypothetical protein